MTTQLRLVSVAGLVFLLTAVCVLSNADPPGTTTLAAQTTSNTYKTVYDGWKWWHVYCYRCHGVDAVGSTNAPNLIDPNRKLSPASLDKKQVSEIQLYVRARTDKVLPPGRPDEVGPNGKPWVPPAGWPGRN